MELLLEPYQTDCCGHHFTGEVAERLGRDGKPCPMCKEPLSTHTDKFHRRRVNEAEVRCLYLREGGCVWVGQLGNLRDHVLCCPKQPWSCTHCGHRCLKEGERDHTEQCDQLPVQCPNGCEVGSIPRAQLLVHRSVCLSEEVSCEYAALGCRERLQRRHLQQHMEEGEGGHILRMSAMNLSLTQRLVQKMEEQEAEIARLQSQLSAAENQHKKGMDDLRESTANKFSEFEKRVSSEVTSSASHTEASFTTSLTSLQSQLLDIQRQLDSAHCTVPPVEFTLTNFEALKSHQLEWRSPPFHTHHGGYKMCLGVSPYGVLRGFGTHVSLRLYKMVDSNSQRLPWDVRIRLCVHVQNQITGTWEREYMNESVRSKPDEACVVSSAEYNYIRHTELRHYVRNDVLKLRVTGLNIYPTRQ